MVPGHFQQQQSQQSIHNRNSDNNRQHYQTITMAAMFKLGFGGGGVWRRDNIMEIFHCCHVPILAMGAMHTLMEIRIDMQC